jgi:Radial spokehead-like protein
MQKDDIEQAINIMSYGQSSEECDSSVLDYRKSSSNASMRDKDADIEDVMNVKNECDEDVRKYPIEWNFSMKIPESTYCAPIEIPAEDTGLGVNRHVYFVCSALDDEWIELPPATPHQINVSRRIRKYLTGNLDADILSYPTFPGKEREYLRALIARISAGTHVAPRRFFKVGESAGGDEDAGTDDEYGDEESAFSKFLFSRKILLIKFNLRVIM